MRAPRRAVFLGYALRHHKRPGALDEIAHLVRVNGGETNVNPVVAEFGLARHRELLGLDLDERVAPVLWEGEAHYRPVA